MIKMLALLLLAAPLMATVACGTNPGGATEDATTVTDAGSTTVTTTSASGNASYLQQSPSASVVKPTTTTTAVTTTTRPSVFSSTNYKKYRKYINVRGGLQNTAYKIAKDNALTVAFMGGSVTDGMGSTKDSGFRGRLLNYLNLNYNATFTEVRDSLGGNGSQYGIYITQQHIAVHKPDLVFIDYAVNNGFDGVTDVDTLWNHYETMIHTIRKANPYADIVLLYVSSKDNASKAVIPVLEQIADKYQLVSVNAYEAINNAIVSKGQTWGYYYSDNVHPTDAGYDVIAEALSGAIQYGLTSSAQSYTYQKATTPTAKTAIQSEAKAVLTSSLKKVPSGWEKNPTFSYYQNDTKYNGCIQTTTNNPITVKFKGTHFGVLVEFASKCGVLEYRVDNGPTQTLDCYMGYSNPKARLLMENAANAEHTVTLKLQEGANKRMAIAAFLLNGTIISVS